MHDLWRSFCDFGVDHINLSLEPRVNLPQRLFYIRDDLRNCVEFSPVNSLLCALSVAKLTAAVAYRFVSGVKKPNIRPSPQRFALRGAN